MTEEDAKHKMEVLRIMANVRFADKMRELYEDIQAVLHHGVGETKLSELDWDYILAEADRAFAADLDSHNQHYGK